MKTVWVKKSSTSIYNVNGVRHQIISILPRWYPCVTLTLWSFNPSKGVSQSPVWYKQAKKKATTINPVLWTFVGYMGLSGNGVYIKMTCLMGKVNEHDLFTLIHQIFGVLPDFKTQPYRPSSCPLACASESNLSLSCSWTSHGRVARVPGCPK